MILIQLYSPLKKKIFNTVSVQNFVNKSQIVHFIIFKIDISTKLNYFLMA